MPLMCPVNPKVCHTQGSIGKGGCSTTAVCQQTSVVSSRTGAHSPALRTVTLLNRTERLRVRRGARRMRYEQRIAQEIASDAPETALEEQQSPLSPRDAAGIAADPLRKLLNAGESGQITQEMEDLLTVVALFAGSAGYQLAAKGDIEAAERAKAAITQAFVGKQLNQLQIKRDAAGMAEIQKRLLQYLQVGGADAAKREAGDFSPGELERISPAAPQIRVS